jgi:hypothetical protein
VPHRIECVICSTGLSCIGVAGIEGGCVQLIYATQRPSQMIGVSCIAVQIINGVLSATDQYKFERTCCVITLNGGAHCTSLHCSAVRIKCYPCQAFNFSSVHYHRGAPTKPVIATDSQSKQQLDTNNELCQIARTTSYTVLLPTEILNTTFNPGLPSNSCLESLQLVVVRWGLRKQKTFNSNLR